ncbi:hypothetical protein TUBRATIS_007610 [Tubulinosema ratisbonensis]|uniref:Uncharacterized protein n=1 Tax=Tubulinosema ratisbonensis TaxID=291195 RepID=A0A437AND2_9MICR|nr:hypothetical protein TUBRATIS_007610 [Tubulinosema ratisbonensis]
MLKIYQLIFFIPNFYFTEFDLIEMDHNYVTKKSISDTKYCSFIKNWIKTKFYKRVPYNCTQNFNDKICERYESSYYIEKISANLTIKPTKSTYIKKIFDKICIENYCIYFFDINYIYINFKKTIDKTYKQINLIFPTEKAIIESEFLSIILIEYFVREIDDFEKILVCKPSKKPKLFFNDIYNNFLTNIFLYKEQLIPFIFFKSDSKLYKDIELKEIKTNKIKLRKYLVSRLKELLKFMLQSNHFKELYILVPEIQIFKNLIDLPKIKFNQLNQLTKIHYLLVLILTKYQTITFLFFGKNNQLATQKYLPEYKLIVFNVLKYSIRCYIGCLLDYFYSYLGGTQINDYFKILTFISYLRINDPNKDNYLFSKEKLVENDYEDYLFFKYDSNFDIITKGKKEL